MSWSKDYKKSIDCSNPKGFSQKAHCAGRKSRQGGKQTKSKSVNETMKLSELKEAIRSVSRKKFHESLNEGNISKIYLTYLAVQKKLRELEDEQKKMLKQWQGEKDPKKKEQSLDKMKKGTKTLQAVRKNLNNLENDYINNMSYDDSYSQ
jgi:hypothetical protein